MAETTPTTKPSGLVLYVDDERGNRVVFEQSLKTEFNIICASDPETALDIMAKNDVAVLVTDMRMPTMNGEELLRIVKERSPQTIRMVITAYADVDPIIRAINEGLAVRYIIKPWIRTELVQVLRWATEAHVFSRSSAALHLRLIESERLATLGSFIGPVVHDLKTPLMSLLTNIEVVSELAEAAPVLRAALAQMRQPPANRDRLYQVIDDLEPVMADFRKSILHLNTMITSMRDLGKPGSETKGPLDTDPLPIVRHAMAVCQNLAMNVRAQIDYAGPGILPHVRMSATELTQVLINLVANGTQAVAARGTPNGKISIVAREQGGVLELAVRDDGVGMAADVLTRVGTPFFTTRAEGTGLGIAQCQRLVGTAGGRFKIESQVGVGTTVTITLPIAA
ncbi:MAG: Two component response regulator [Myxococcales bacterium]|nr:Two component response regulator [Myxococcales bacterium]